MLTDCTDAMSKMLKEKANLLNILGLSRKATPPPAPVAKAATPSSTVDDEPEEEDDKESENEANEGPDRKLGDIKTLTPKQKNAVAHFAAEVKKEQGIFAHNLLGMKEKYKLKSTKIEAALREANMETDTSVVELGADDSDYKEPASGSRRLLDEPAQEDHEEADEENTAQDPVDDDDDVVEKKPTPEEKEIAKPPEKTLELPEIPEVPVGGVDSMGELLSMCVTNMARLAEDAAHLMQGKVKDRSQEDAPVKDQSQEVAPAAPSPAPPAM